jgi:hypothetical protein
MHNNHHSDMQTSGAMKLTKILLKVLGYKSDLITLLRNSSKEYESKVSLLPVKARLFILHHPAYSCVRSQGQSIYFELLRNPILSSQRIMRDDATLTLDSLEYFLVCLLRYPTTNVEGGVESNGPGINYIYIIDLLFFTVWCDGVVWRCVMWCGVMWCGVVWCGVVWCAIWRGVVHR